MTCTYRQIEAHLQTHATLRDERHHCSLTLKEVMVARWAPTSGEPLRALTVRSNTGCTVGWMRQSALENVSTPVMAPVVAPVRSVLS